MKQFTAPPGGIRTVEVGAITGDVEIRLTPEGSLAIRYAEADEWYTVAGNVAGRDEAELAAVLTRDPGTDVDGNPAAVSL